MTRKAIAELLETTIANINIHIKNIYDEEELAKEAIVSKMEIVQTEGDREFSRLVDFYNLDAIIAVGYRSAQKRLSGFANGPPKPSMSISKRALF